MLLNSKNIIGYTVGDREFCTKCYSINLNEWDLVNPITINDMNNNQMITCDECHQQIGRK